MSSAHPYNEGETYFFRTTGRCLMAKLEKVYPLELVISDPVQVNEVGRLSLYESGFNKSDNEQGIFEGAQLILTRSQIIESISILLPTR